jgi:hypothetical protein
MSMQATQALQAPLPATQADPAWALTAAWLDGADASEHIAQTERADRALLRLVGCAAAATLLLALATGLGA